MQKGCSGFATRFLARLEKWTLPPIGFRVDLPHSAARSPVHECWKLNVERLTQHSSASGSELSRAKFSLWSVSYAMPDPLQLAIQLGLLIFCRSELPVIYLTSMAHGCHLWYQGFLLRSGIQFSIYPPSVYVSMRTPALRVIARLLLGREI